MQEWEEDICLLDLSTKDTFFFKTTKNNQKASRGQQWRLGFDLGQEGVIEAEGKQTLAITSLNMAQTRRGGHYMCVPS